MNPEKSKYRTISLVRGLTDDVEKLIDEFGYWPSLSSFVREAVLEKLRRERIAPGRFIPQPIVFYDEEKREKDDVIAGIDKVVLELEEDPDVPEEEKEAIRNFASEVFKKLVELDNKLVELDIKK